VRPALFQGGRQPGRRMRLTDVRPQLISSATQPDVGRTRGVRWHQLLLVVRLGERTRRAVARTAVFSATAARMSAFNACSPIVAFMEIDGTPGVAFEAGVEEA
jgi:hypothetical protein